MTEHFQREYIDDLTVIDPALNFFTGVWDEIFAAGHRPKALLDVGCGTGVFSMYAQQQTNCVVSGVDGSEYALAKAKQLGFTNTSAIGDFNTDRLNVSDCLAPYRLCLHFP